MDLIKQDLSELFALAFVKIAESDFVYTLAFTNVDPLVPNIATNIYAHKVSDEFEYGTKRTRTSGVICP